MEARGEEKEGKRSKSGREIGRGRRVCLGVQPEFVKIESPRSVNI